MNSIEKRMTKEFGVLVTKTDDTTVLKQFDTEDAVYEFIDKLTAISSFTYEIITRTRKGIDGRSTSEAFVEIVAGNVTDGKWYRCVPVRPRKGMLFCTECHDYKSFTKQEDEYGTIFKACPGCGMPDTEYNIKIANGLAFG